MEPTPEETLTGAVPPGGVRPRYIDRGREPWSRFAETTLRPQLRLWLNWDFEGLENIPAEGPVILASNHVSYFDPVALGYMTDSLGRRIRFLAKSELFRIPLVGTVLKGAGQIPVYRGTGSTAPLAAASDALDGGLAVGIFPEGTTTRDPEFRIATAKTGTARLSLMTGVPVTPAAIWGSHRIWKSKFAPVPAFGRPVWVKIGSPLDFSDLGAADDPAALRIATERMMSAIEVLRDDLAAHYPERWR